MMVGKEVLLVLGLDCENSCVNVQIYEFEYSKKCSELRNLVDHMRQQVQIMYNCLCM